MVSIWVINMFARIKFINRVIRVGGGFFSTLKIFLFVLKNEGLRGVIWRLNVVRRMGYVDDLDVANAGSRTDQNIGYDIWLRFKESKIEEKSLEDMNIVFSILMPVFRPPHALLQRAIESVLHQTYSNWQLCIVDDASGDADLSRLVRSFSLKDKRIFVKTREINGHISIASNDALAMASGDFVVLLDNDDELHIDALACIAEKIAVRADAEIVFSDEDKLSSSGKRHSPYFKSEFNPVLFLAQNMISHLGVYRTSTLREIGGFRVGVEGAQDWDLGWRVVEAKGADKVVHVPRVLYHWRELPGSTSRDVGEKSYAVAAQVRVISDHLERIGRRALVEPSPRAQGMVRVRFAFPEARPLVSIVIPTRDRKDLLQMCIESLKQHTEYSQYEVIVVDNGSVEQDALAYLELLKQQSGVRVMREDIPFNYSSLNNLGVAQAKGEYILMLNNDIEFTHADWLDEMMSWAALPEVGCVGAKLWYPNGTLQHGGVILGIGGMAGHAHRGISKIDNGYVGRAVVHQNLSAVTGACMLVKRSIYEKVGGLDERFAVAYNDIDFCLRVREAGYQNVWTPYAEMVHHESATRGMDSNPEKRMRLEAEVALMKERWGSILQADPAYSPHLTRLDEDFSINVH